MICVVVIIVLVVRSNNTRSPVVVQAAPRMQYQQPPMGQPVAMGQPQQQPVMMGQSGGTIVMGSPTMTVGQPVAQDTMPVSYVT